MASEPGGCTVWAWRHPRPRGAEGRCIGRTDLPVDRRRAKRLARRIQRVARRHGLGRVVHTSPLRRCRDVGRWLRAWGWTHHIDDRLLEASFGRWEGRPWSDIPRAEIDAWCGAFVDRAPSDGEPLSALLQRARTWAPREITGPHCVVVAHAGWMSARHWLRTRGETPPRAEDWPAPPGYRELRQL
ncbi:MAG TPA: histidine phosphatase family protein [Methylibium sp.]|nr:histidine phosphatase family protein [Methylibium sp.]